MTFLKKNSATIKSICVFLITVLPISNNPPPSKRTLTIWSSQCRHCTFIRQKPKVLILFSRTLEIRWTVLAVSQLQQIFVTQIKNFSASYRFIKRLKMDYVCVCVCGGVFLFVCVWMRIRLLTFRQYFIIPGSGQEVRCAFYCSLESRTYRFECHLVCFNSAGFSRLQLFFFARYQTLTSLTVRLIGQVVWRKFTNNSEEVSIHTFKANIFP